MPRSILQNKQMREEKKSQILKEALKQFADKGFYATKIKDIAKGVGMAQGLLYNYYQSKEEIYIELVCSSLDKMNAAADNLESLNIPPHMKITSGVKKIIETIKQSDNFNQTSRLISQTINSLGISKEKQQLISQKREYPYQIVAKIMLAGQLEGTIIEGDPDQLAVLYWSIINGLVLYKVSRNDNSSIPDIDLITNIFLK